MSYHAPVGRYALGDSYFASAYSKGPLHALSGADSGGNGVYRCGSGGVFSTSTYRSVSYWVDAMFKDALTSLGSAGGVLAGHAAEVSGRQGTELPKFKCSAPVSSSTTPNGVYFPRHPMSWSTA